MFKKHMTPLTKGGQLHAHAGKGSQMVAMPDRRAIAGLASAPNAGLNDYAKATPMAQPAAPSMPPAGGPDFPGGM